MKNVLDFLTRLKIISKENIFFIPRTKNQQALIDLGITKEYRLKLIYDLAVDDYISGPEEDHDSDFPGEIWVFGKIFDKTEIYIKLKIISNGKDKAVCLSFHPAEFPLRRKI